MSQFIDNKKHDDIDDDLPLCNCNLCWTARQIITILPNNIIFRNPFVLFILMIILPSVFFACLLSYLIFTDKK